jgi:ribosomal protein L11 methyltransferase
VTTASDDAPGSTDDALGSTDDATRPTGGAWLELAVEADPEAVEAVSEILGRVATGGTTVEPAFDLVDEGLGARIDPARPAVVRGYVPLADGSGGAAAAEASAAKVAGALGHLQAFGLRRIGELRTRRVQAADWADAWRAFFPVMRIGRRLVIRPTWREHEATPGDAVLALDPGMAFGTGLHPTTRLSLAALERVADDGRVDGARVLDVGCGSGILAIAALKLGGATALGVDTDPIAVESTVANAARNELGDRLLAREGSLPSGEPPFDIVLANLVAAVLIQLASSLRAEVVAGGTLVASGIFIDREAEVTAAFEGAGLRVAARTSEGDWLALELRTS